MENQKRKRSTNWSETEKVLLKRLISENIEIIENKDISTNTNNEEKGVAGCSDQVSPSVSVEKRAAKKNITDLRRHKQKMADNDYEKKKYELARDARVKEMANAEKIHQFKKSILIMEKRVLGVKSKE